MKRMISVMLLLACVLGLAACGGSSTGVVPDMNQVYASMAEKLPEMEPFSADSVLNAYGVKSEDCKQMVVSSYYDGAATAEIWLIEAVSEDALKTVKTLAENRLTSMGDQFKTYDAKAYDLVQDAELIIHGNCLALIVADNAAELVAIYEAAAQLN